MSEALRPRMEPPQESIKHTRTGMQDPKLEVGRRDRSTPTVSGDIGVRARAYQSLVDRAVFYQFATEGAREDIPGGMRRHIIHGAEQVVRDVHDAGFNAEGFRTTVRSHMARVRKLAERDEQETEFEFSERQAMMGDVPPRTEDVTLVDLRSHYGKMSKGFGNDAGFPAPERGRRGW